MIGIDWLFSTWLPASRFQAAAYAGIALLVGLTLNAVWQSLGKAIDFLFFRQWYRTRQQATAIEEVVRRASSTADLYAPLTAGIADAFSLASTALFERIEGGGFVRVAAYGWIPGTIWHILPGDLPGARIASGKRAVDLTSVEWLEPHLPTGVARPIVMLPITGGRQASAILLCGAREDGAGLDPDSVRALRRICADAAIVYGKVPAGEADRNAPLGTRAEPLRA